MKIDSEELEKQRTIRSLKSHTIRSLRGLRCNLCVYQILKNDGHYCGSFVREPFPLEKNTCVAYEPRTSLKR